VFGVNERILDRTMSKQNTVRKAPRALTRNRFAGCTRNRAVWKPARERAECLIEISRPHGSSTSLSRSRPANGIQSSQERIEHGPSDPPANRQGFAFVRAAGPARSLFRSARLAEITERTTVRCT